MDFEMTTCPWRIENLGQAVRALPVVTDFLCHAALSGFTNVSMATRVALAEHQGAALSTEPCCVGASSTNQRLCTIRLMLAPRCAEGLIAPPNG
jgi:hypothetical protein